jgi:flagellar hook-associated protein 2
MSSTANTLVPVATFNGTSTYSSSFQQVLTRAVQTASLPGELVQASINTLDSQQQALSSLLSTFATLQGDVQSIASAAQGNVTANVSDSSLVSATASSSAQLGTYTITVDNVGSAATAMSQAGTPPVTDPTSTSISSSSTFTLAVNGTDTTITPSGSSLDDLATAINSADAGVQATVVNVGGSSADYRLFLTSATVGQNEIALTDSGGNSLVTQIAQGADAQYNVNGETDTNGKPVVIDSDSDQITLAPGLTVNLLGQDSSTPVTVTVSADQSGLSSALSSFATDYNSAQSALTAQTGQNAGPLGGQSIIYTLRDMLYGLAQYGGGPANIPTLNALGLQVDQTGTMSFDASTFSGLSGTDVSNFLGTTASGGFLQAANNALNSVTDPNTGCLETSVNNITSEITGAQSKLSDDTAQVTTLQNSLMTQLSAADAAIATLQSQTTYFTDLFQAEYGNPNENGA